MIPFSDNTGRRRLPRDGPFRKFPEEAEIWILPAMVILLNAVWLWPEVAVSAPPLNDEVLHTALVSRLMQETHSLSNLLDPWIPYWTTGYPVFHAYQPLPHLCTAMAGLLFSLDAATACRFLKWILLSCFPASFFIGARLVGLNRLEAAVAASFSAWISSPGLFGMEYNSYVWSGFGLAPQLWAMVLLPPAWGLLYRTIREGRAILAAVLFLGALILTQPFYAYLIVVSATALVLWPDRKVAFRSRLFRSFILLISAALLTAFFWLPYMADRAYVNRSVWEQPWKFDSHGAPIILEWLGTGQIFDSGRLPVLSLAVVAGFFAAWRQPRIVTRMTAILTLFWLAIYCGRPSWGGLLDLFPLAGDIHWHRFLGGVHFFSLLLAGTGLAWFIRQIPGSPRLRRLSAACLLCLFLFIAGKERYQYFSANTRQMQQSAAAWTSMQEDWRATGILLHRLSGPLGGRIYAGLGNNWGKDFRIGHTPVYALFAAEGLNDIGYLYHTFPMSGDLQVLFREDLFTHWDLFHIRQAVVPKGFRMPSFARKEGSFLLWEVWSIPAVAGPFSLVRSDIAYQGDRRQVFLLNRMWMDSPYLPARRHPALFLQGASEMQRGDSLFRKIYSLDSPVTLPPLHPADLQPPAGQISGCTETQSRKEFRIRLESEEDAVLMFKVSFHPNWKAWVDGRSQPTLLLVPGFVGVGVSKGAHEVRFLYQPGPWKGVLLIGGWSVVLLGFAFHKKIWKR